MREVKLKALSGMIFFLSLQSSAETQPLPTVDCFIIPSRSAELSAPVSGIVKAVHSTIRDSVRAGELVAELNSDIERYAVDIAKAHTKMNAEQNIEKSNLEFYNLQLKRITQLRNKNLVSLQDEDDANRLKQSAYWRIEQVRQNMAIRRLELQKAEAQLRNKRILAPFDGVVARQYKFPGEYVEGQPILKLVDLKTLHVEAVLPMEYYNYLARGMKATVYPEIDQQSGYEATVDVVEPLGDVESGTFGVRLVVENPTRKLPAGIKCYLQFEPFEEEYPLAPPPKSSS